MGWFGSKYAPSAPVEGCYSLPEVPGRPLAASHGIVTYWQPLVRASDPPDVMNRIMEALLQAAQSRGGNAVVNLHIQAGSQHGTGIMFAYGEAVTLR
jgi:hypothetical protein